MDKNNSLKIFVGSVYIVTRKKTQEKMFDVFAENLISLHIFMAVFDMGRNYFCYDTFFPHYIVPVEIRAQILEAGATEIDREGEKKCVHDWHIKAVNHKFQ